MKEVYITSSGKFLPNEAISNEEMENYLGRINGKDSRAKDRVLKHIKEEEERQKKLEYIKIKEWEEKFDREQKAKEHRENLREQRLRQQELDRLKSFEEKENRIENNFSSGLEKFDIDKTKEN